MPTKIKNLLPMNRLQPPTTLVAPLDILRNGSLLIGN